MCGLYLDNHSAMHKSGKQLADELKNMQIDKLTGVTKIAGLSQTVSKINNTVWSTKPKK